MSNIIGGISKSNSIQSINSAYNNNLANTYSRVSTFSNTMNQQMQSISSYGIRNVPMGKSSYNTTLPNYNVNSDNIGTTNPSTSELIDSIVDSDTNSQVFRVKIDAKDEATKERIANAVRVASDKYDVDPNLILAVIQKESYFNPNVTSKSGAQGLMQVMPANFKHLGITNGYNIEESINGGTKLLREYIDRYDGDIEMALMAYNGGPGTMARRGVKSINDLYKMPTETRNYVPKVMSIFRGEI